MAKKTKVGADFGKARSKFSHNKLAKAIQLRAAGEPLREVARLTGLSMSYVCRLTRDYMVKGRGRVSVATTEDSLTLLRARLAKLEAEARNVRAQIKRLTAAPAEPKPQPSMESQEDAR